MWRAVLLYFATLLIALCIYYYNYQIRFFKSYVPLKFGSLSTEGICTKGLLFGGWGYAAFTYNEATQKQIIAQQLAFFKDVNQSLRLAQFIGESSRIISYSPWREITPADLSEGLPVGFGQCDSGLSKSERYELYEAMRNTKGYVTTSNLGGSLYVVPELRFVFFSYMD